MAKKITGNVKMKEAAKKLKEKKSLSPDKAMKILHDGMVKGKKLTGKQRRFMGWMAGGGKKRKSA